MPIQKLRIEDVENYLVPLPNIIEDQRADIDVTPYFAIDKVFDSRSELIQWAQDIGIRLNMVVVIINSDAGLMLKKPKLNLGCERGGVFRSHHKKKIIQGKSDDNNDRSRCKRYTGTKKCNCPFKLRGIPYAHDKWKVEVICGLHNHRLGETMIGHSYVGRLKDDEQNIVEHLTKSGVKPKEVLTTLKQRNRENKSTISTVYNAQKKCRRAETEGRSAMQQVMKLLFENNYLEWHNWDSKTEEVLDLFWANPESIKIAKCFPSIMMLDCTYKTNRFKRPLLEIIGVTSTAKTFCVGFAFLLAEKEENYTWALYKLKDVFDPSRLPSVFVTDRELALIGVIRVVFPGAVHLLCTWHITKNVTAHCKKSFETNEDWIIFEREWTGIVYSTTEKEYADRWSAFEKRWMTHIPHCLQYIQDTWLPWKEHFVCAWTNKVKHFGNTTTSRVESAHSRLKKYIGSSQGNFTSIWHALHRMIVGEITGVVESLEHSLIRVIHDHHLPALRDLRGYISHHALGLILEEIKRSKNIGIDKITCGCILRMTHGLPCAHEIVDFGSLDRTIPFLACDPHWAKLSIVPTPEDYGDLDYDLDIERLKKRLQECNYDQRKVLLKKIRELANPETTWLNEPFASNVSKGRPRKLTKKQITADRSTKRNPSLFEYSKTIEDLQSISKTAPKKRPKRKKLLLKDLTDEDLIEQVLALFNPKIKDHVVHALENVASDGHCGYRACAELLGMSKEDGWKKVRTAMLHELREHIELYTYQLGGEKSYKKLEERLNYFKDYGCNKKYWMHLPDMGPLFATTFNCVFCVLSPLQSCTYLPLRNGPMSDFQIVPIILFDEVHFMKVFLKQDAPIPKVMVGWDKIRYGEAARWEELVKPKFEDWKARIGCP